MPAAAAAPPPSSASVCEFFDASSARSTCPPAEADLFRDCSQLYTRRLWHQLSGKLHELIVLLQKRKRDPGELIALYQKAISEFEAKLNPLTLICLCAPLLADYEDDVDAALAFLDSIAKKVNRASPGSAASAPTGSSLGGGGTKPQINREAYMLARILQGKLQLNRKQDIATTKSILEECEESLACIDGVVQVHKEFYLLASELYKREGDHANYYQSSLRYLGCSELSDRDSESNTSLAIHLCLAALLGKNIFNFGELLAHPIIRYLDGDGGGGDNVWLVHLLEAFNRGDVSEFRALKTRWCQQVDLAKNEDVLYEKICLLAVMEMTFRRSATDRQLSFGDIAEHTGLNKDKVELLVMKALSRGLIKGQIDQVDETLHVSWVQPRVLDRSQLGSLMNKLDKWGDAISGMEKLIETNAGEILTM